MSFRSIINGQIDMTKEVFESLINDGITYRQLIKYEIGDLGEIIYHYAPKKLNSILDYFNEFRFEDNGVYVHSDGKHNDIDDLLSSIASMLNPEHKAYIKLVGEDGYKCCYWLRKNEVVCGEWQEPEAPGWFCQKTPLFC